jgi:outer membrane protein assembly factor BamB
MGAGWRSLAGQVAVAVLAAWPAYLHGPGHSSYAASQQQIRPDNARRLVSQWHYAGQGFTASPVVADGSVFIGARSGWFYQFSAATGQIMHQAFIGVRPASRCGSGGVADTAAVAADPADHQDTVYVGGPSGYLYAFNAADLALKWKSVIALPSRRADYFDWSSPTVANGRIYLGVASQCDDPLIRGAVIAFSQATGRKLAEFHTVPSGALGGSVWSSIAIGPDGDVYASTGNGAAGAPHPYHTDSIIKLGPDKLRLLGSFIVPRAQRVPDGDFGGSPVVFGRYIGACDKNGIFYAVRRSTMTLAWQRRIGARSGGGGDSQCTAAPAYDGRHLYFGGPATTIKGKAYRGSVQERDPANGRLRWATGLPNGIIGSPSLDGGGVLAAGTFDSTSTPNATYLINAATGHIITRLVQGRTFPQTAFAGGWLYTANLTGLYAWAVPAA